MGVCFRTSCECYTKEESSQCKVYLMPSKGICPFFRKNPPREKSIPNKDLNPCVCLKRPKIITGKHRTLEQKVFFVACTNPRCKTQPATENCTVLRKAKKLWNSNIVTNSLFKGSAG